MACECGGHNEEMTVETTVTLELTESPRDLRAELAHRINALELAVLSLGSAEFGDSAGHPFRGNQYRGGEGGDSNRGERSAAARMMDVGPDVVISHNPEAKNQEDKKSLIDRVRSLIGEQPYTTPLMLAAEDETVTPLVLAAEDEIVITVTTP